MKELKLYADCGRNDTKVTDDKNKKVVDFTECEVYIINNDGTETELSKQFKTAEVKNIIPTK